MIIQFLQLVRILSYTHSNINKGHFSFRKAYYVITIITQLIGNTLH